MKMLMMRALSVAAVVCACAPKPGGDTEDSSGSQTGAGSSGVLATDPSASAAGSTGAASDTAGSSSHGTTETGDDPTSTGEVMASCPGGTRLMQAQAEEFYAGIELCPATGPHRDEAVACKNFPTDIWECKPGMCADGCGKYLTGICGQDVLDDCSCRYPCSLDAECGVGAACLCGTSDGSVARSECYPASCLTDADCGAFQCGLSPGLCGVVESLHCRTPEDDCTVDAECYPDNNRCAFEATLGRWSCSAYSACA